MKLNMILGIFLALAIGFILGSYFGLFSKKEVKAVEPSFSSDKPSQDEIQTAVQAKQLEFYTFRVEKFDMTPLGNNAFQINFKGQLTTKEDLYALANQEAAYDKYQLSPMVPLNTVEGKPLRYLRKMATAGKAQDVYGRCRAEKYLDRWSIKFERFEGGEKAEGVPLSMLGKSEFLIEGSPEEEMTFQRLLKETSEKEKKLKANRDSILPYLNTKTVYEGGITPKNGSKPQRIRIIFKEIAKDGSLILATVSNPEDEKDWMSLRGGINTEYINNNFTPENNPKRRFYLAYPLVMRNEVQSYRDRKQSLNFYVQYGNQFWFGMDGDKLIGKVGREFDQIDYTFTLNQKSTP